MERTQLLSDKDGGRSVRERILAKKTEEQKFRKEPIATATVFPNF